MLLRVILALAVSLIVSSPASAHERLWSVFEPGAELYWPESVVERNGASGVTLADVDGDGVADFAIGWPGLGPGWGRVELRSGAGGGVLWAVDGATLGWSMLGIALVALDDVDSDGVRDLAVGAQGAILFLSGVSGAQLAIVSSSVPTPSFEYGARIAVVGDQDGDGLADLLVGDPQGYCLPGGSGSVNCTVLGSGYAELRSGRDGSLITRIDGTADGEAWGGWVARYPDLDGDGRSEYALSAYLGPSTPPARHALRVYAGPTAQLVAEIPAGSSNFARLTLLRVTTIPDVDLDGREDVVLLDPASPASLRLLSGGTGPELWRRSYDSQQGWPYVLASPGDWDGDGFADVAYGNPHPGPGFVEILSGRDGTRLEALVGRREDDRFGTAFGPLGDLDGDGRPELWIASPTAWDAGADGRRIEVLNAAPEVLQPQVFCEPQSQLGAAIGWTGTTSLAANDLVLTCAPVAPQSILLLLFGTEATHDFLGACVGGLLGPSNRVHVAIGSAAGMAQVGFDSSRANGGGGFPPGSTRFFQWWQRLGPAPAQVRYSSALRATFTP